MTNEGNASTSAAVTTGKPAVFELQRKTWVVERQENKDKLLIEQTNMKQNVYMFKCTNSILHVKGKVNTIIMDSCKRCAVIFEDLISSCEFVNCQSVKAQANGRVPLISIEKTDGAQVYLNKTNLDAEIISSKSSEMNVCIPTDCGDMSEFPIVEQYKTVWNGKTFVTTPMLLNSQ